MYIHIYIYTRTYIHIIYIASDDMVALLQTKSQGNIQSQAYILHENVLHSKRERARRRAREKEQTPESESTRESAREQESERETESARERERDRGENARERKSSQHSFVKTCDS